MLRVALTFVFIGIVASFGAVADVVHFPDPGLEAAIREAIGQPGGGIYDYSLKDLEILDASSRGITNLEGIEYCTGLVELDLRDNDIEDLSPLSTLTTLTELSLSGNRISDLTPLTGLSQLLALRLAENEITDLSPLATWVNEEDPDSPRLQDLELDDNAIVELIPLSGFRHLRKLTLSGNAIEDITPLAGLTELALLNLDSNHIADIQAIAGLTKMKVLVLNGNAIEDITPLVGLTGLFGLWLNDNQTTDLQPLVENPGIGYMDRIYVCGNSLDLTPGSAAEADIQTLTRRGAYVYECPG